MHYERFKTSLLVTLFFFRNSVAVCDEEFNKKRILLMFKKSIKEAEKYAKKHNFTYKLHTFKKKELWDSDNKDEEHRNWAEFEKKPGVYIISTNKKIVYIGMSNVDTGTRLLQHFTNNEKLAEIIDESDIAVLTFSKEYNSLTSALESYLIDKYNPVLNKTKY